MLLQTPACRPDSESCVKSLGLCHHVWLTSNQYCSLRALWGKKYKDQRGLPRHPMAPSLSWGVTVTSKYLIDPGVQALSPHLALMLTNVQMSVGLEHLSCGVCGPAQPSSRKQVQEPEDRWKEAMSTAPQLSRRACRLHSPILTYLPPHPGPAAFVAPKPACEHGQRPGMVR